MPLLDRVASFLETHASCVPQTALDAAALFVHASACAHGYSEPGPLASWRSDCDRHAWTYVAQGHTIHVVITRIAQRAAILALVDEGACAMLDVPLSRYMDVTALPWRHSHDSAPLSSLYLSSPKVQEWERRLHERVWAHIDAPAAGAPVPRTSSCVDDVPGRVASLSDAPRTSALPLRIGDADRDPWAASPDVLGGGCPLARPPRHDGMIVGPDHPLWQGPHGGAPLPPMGALPGARFDPMSPLAPMQRRGDPDWDEFAPPSSMFL